MHSRLFVKFFNGAVIHQPSQHFLLHRRLLKRVTRYQNLRAVTLVLVFQPPRNRHSTCDNISLISYHARLHCTGIPPTTPYFIRAGEPMLPTEHLSVCKPHRTSNFSTDFPSATRCLYTVVRHSWRRDRSFSCISSVLQSAKQAWFSISLGAFHTARMASPIYSISVPLLRVTEVG